MKLGWLGFLVAGGAVGCGQSDQELCEDVQKKLRQCGSVASDSCPESLADKVREQYECILDTPCHELGECAEVGD